MARRSGRSVSIAESMQELFGGLGKVALFLAMLYFIVWLVEAAGVDVYMDIRNISRNSTGYYLYDEGITWDVSSEIASIRGGFALVRALLWTLMGLISFVAFVVVFAGFILPTFNRILGRV